MTKEELPNGLYQHPVCGLCEVEHTENDEVRVTFLWQKGDILATDAGEPIGVVAVDASEGKEDVTLYDNNSLSVGDKGRNISFELRMKMHAHNENHELKDELTRLGL